MSNANNPGLSILLLRIRSFPLYPFQVKKSVYIPVPVQKVREKRNRYTFAEL
jgi:hypothetical protein